MSAVSQRLADARDQATKLICDLGRKESVAEPIA